MAVDAQAQASTLAKEAEEAHAEKLRQEKLEAKRLAKLEARKCDGSHAAFDDGDDEPETPAAPGKDDEAEAEAPPPFQRLEFLVRDWNEFDDDMSDDDMTKMMATYLEEVLQPRAADDLQFTREQIAACFTKLSCWLLPHPGFAVTKKSYDGAVGDIEPLFKRCVHGLMKHVFSEGLEPKLIGGAPLSAAELANYVRAYAGMFADGAKFPQAQTMLEATAEANNRNAAGAALEAYCETMDAACGARAGVEYLAHKELKAKFREARDGALLAFDTAATMGRKAAIADARAGLVREMDKAKDRFRLMNDARNPFKNAEFYVIPLAIATASWIMRKVTDTVCPEDGSFVANTCNRAEEALGKLYGGIVFLMLIAGYNRFKGLKKYMRGVIKPLLEAALADDAKSA